MKIVEVTHQGVKMRHYVNEPPKPKNKAAKAEDKAVTLPADPQDGDTKPADENTTAA